MFSAGEGEDAQSTTGIEAEILWTMTCNAVMSGGANDIQAQVCSRIDEYGACSVIPKTQKRLETSRDALFSTSVVYVLQPKTMFPTSSLYVTSVAVMMHTVKQRHTSH